MARTALFEFMPYGAPELIEGGSRRLFRSTEGAIALLASLFLAALAWTLTVPRNAERERIVVLPYRELGAPPPLTAAPPPPEIVIRAPVASPAIGVPVPVPDVQAPPDQTIASQSEMAEATASVAGSGDGSLVVALPPPAEDLPKLGDFVYADELPVIVTDVPPVYPQMAREALVEGEVLLRVLVGKNGHVIDVHVDRSIPMLDQAAVDAARGWVFKPALCNNRPVVVWVVRRVRFSLTTRPS